MIRASITLRKIFQKEMDCRVKPGNDVLGAFAPACWRALPLQNLSSHRRAPHRRLEFLAELGEFVRGEIADRPVVQAAIAPAPDIESLDRIELGGTAFGARGLGHEQIDDVGAPPVARRCQGAARAGGSDNAPLPQWALSSICYRFRL